jgi:FkbM family methyltransferase
MDVELSIIRAIGRFLPPIRGSTAMINRVLKPLYLRKPRSAVTTTALGFTLTLDPAQAVDGGLLFYPHLFNRHELHWVRRHLRPSDTFVDAGANIGAFSLVASDITDHVIAIEANPMIFPILLANIKVNNRPITAIHAGISDKRETLTLHIQEQGNLGASSFVVPTGGRDIDVECKPLHELAPAADFIKMDIEGMEHTVLSVYFQHCKPRALILEINDINRTVLDLCQDSGFRIAGRTRENVLLLRG